MLFNTKSKTNNKLILQHPIRSPPSSQNAIFDTGTTKHLVMQTKLLIKNKNKLSPFMVD